MKLDWFNLIIGITWIVMGIIVYIRQKDIILSTIFFVIGIVFAGVKSLKKVEKNKTQKIMEIISTIIIGLAVIFLFLSVFGVI
ncbi:MAG: hypothetical protein QT10_C0007G0087 [archaeon GW2011_AR19]|nr:MAG: hypothetical protein QT10_C0007G0087 [archaeon GW2011_AR19]